MWPFKKDLDGLTDGIKRYREWLRKWLLASWKYVAVVLILFGLLIPLVHWQQNQKSDQKADSKAVSTFNSSNISEAKEQDMDLQDTNLASAAASNKEKQQGNKEQEISRDTDSLKPTDTTDQTSKLDNSVNTKNATNINVTNIIEGKEMILPVEGEIINTFGLQYHQVYNDYRLHDGIDISQSFGTPVKSALKGIVEEIKQDNYWGTVVTIDHGEGWKTCYRNLADCSVEEGQEIRGGEILGTLNQRGHLHFSILHHDQPVDPQDYLK